MIHEEALAWLGNGRAFLEVQVALDVCDALGTTLDSSVVTTWNTFDEAARMGIQTDVSPGKGVWVYALGGDICRQLNIPFQRYGGVDLQAREHRQALYKHFEISQHGDGM